MRIETATDAKNNLGRIIDAALREPVIIERSGRKAVVMMSYEDYEEIQVLIDRAWGDKASRAEDGGFVGADRSSELITRLLNAKD